MRSCGVAPRIGAGQVLRPTLRIKLSGVAASNFYGFNIQVLFSGGAASGNGGGYVMSTVATGPTNTGWVDGTFTVIGPEITVPSDGVTSVDMRIQARFSGSGGSALTMDVERWALRNAA